MDGTGELFERFIATAPAGLRLVPLRLPQLADYDSLERALREQLPDGDFSIVAESFSGPLAIRLAARAGQRVHALVFSNAFADRPRSALYALLPWALAFRFPAPRWIIRRYLLGGFINHENLGAVRKAAEQVSAPLMARRLIATLRVNDLTTLRQLDLPMLYLRGTEDRLVLESSVQAMERACPWIIRHDIAAPHLLLQTVPEGAWLHIDPFIRMASHQKGGRR